MLVCSSPAAGEGVASTTADVGDSAVAVAQLEATDAWVDGCPWASAAAAFAFTAARVHIGAAPACDGAASSGSGGVPSPGGASAASPPLTPSRGRPSRSAAASMRANTAPRPTADEPRAAPATVALLHAAAVAPAGSGVAPRYRSKPSACVTNGSTQSRSSALASAGGEAWPPSATRVDGGNEATARSAASAGPPGARCSYSIPSCIAAAPASPAPALPSVPPAEPRPPPSGRPAASAPATTLVSYTPAGNHSAVSLLNPSHVKGSGPTNCCRAYARSDSPLCTTAGRRHPRISSSTAAKLVDEVTPGGDAAAAADDDDDGAQCDADPGRAAEAAFADVEEDAGRPRTGDDTGVAQPDADAGEAGGGEDEEDGAGDADASCVGVAPAPTEPYSTVPPSPRAPQSGT
eukprot:355151-Chlamydomonas_euryale.AAC.7